jgi:hypothetical protein
MLNTVTFSSGIVLTQGSRNAVRQEHPTNEQPKQASSDRELTFGQDTVRFGCSSC